jgi:hypothetical protein
LSIVVSIHQLSLSPLSLSLSLSLSLVSRNSTLLLRKGVWTALAGGLRHIIIIKLPN